MKTLFLIIALGIAAFAIITEGPPQVGGGDTAWYATPPAVDVMATAAPPPTPVIMPAQGSQPTPHGQPSAVSAEYRFISHQPPALRYCFAPDVPQAHRQSIAAGLESWAAAYPVAMATGADCNLYAAQISAGELYTPGVWAEAWGNLCDERIEPFIINFDRTRPADAGLTALAAHELGHVLCLEHTAVAGNVMHLSAYSLPTAADIEAARAVVEAWR
jgi:hypothetical protein